MDFFISHSSKDAEIARLVKEFIERTSVNNSAFCTSSFGTIRNGENFVTAIERQLDKCNRFVVLLSGNYTESKYCMLELGFSYAKLVRSGTSHMLFFTLPGGEALLNDTPLNHLQHYPLFEADTWRMFIDEEIEHNNNILVNNEDIRLFVQKLTSAYLLSTSVFEQTDLVGCCSDSNNPEAIKCSRVADDITISFNLFSNGKQHKPVFISAVLHFYNEIDLYSYYVANNAIQLSCTLINYTDSVRRIQVELQTENNRVICDPFVFELREKQTEIRIPISEISRYVRDLRHIINICFVILADDFLENEGTILIKDLQIR